MTYSRRALEVRCEAGGLQFERASAGAAVGRHLKCAELHRGYATSAWVSRGASCPMIWSSRSAATAKRCDQAIRSLT